jgi:triosephosphate isomerase (TIM)
MRIPFIAGNWKMNTNIDEAVQLVKSMIGDLQQIKDVEIAVCPPFVSLSPVKEVISGSNIKLGAQNMFYEMKGAYTGEVSPEMLRSLCDYVILGHSERRQYFHETDAIVNKKLKAAIINHLHPIFCIGEKLEENESGKTESVIVNQLKNGLEGINADSTMVVAYEPIWAIGTGKAATATQANDVIKTIRKTLGKIWDDKTADNVRILYGGSVTEANIKEFIQQNEIDGALVGGASLKSIDFINIVKTTSSVKSSK